MGTTLKLYTKLHIRNTDMQIASIALAALEDDYAEVTERPGNAVTTVTVAFDDYTSISQPSRMLDALAVLGPYVTTPVRVDFVEGGETCVSYIAACAKAAAIAFKRDTLCEMIRAVRRNHMLDRGHALMPAIRCSMRYPALAAAA